MTVHRVICALFLSAVWSLSLRAQEGGDASPAFSPEKHLPAGALAYVHLDLDELTAGASGTPVGSVFAHPQTQRALGHLPAMAVEQIEQQGMLLKMLLGRGVFELIDVFSGGLSVALYDPVVSATSGAASVAIAIEMGERRDAVIEVLDRLDAIDAQSGTQFTDVEIGGIKARACPLMGTGPDGPPRHRFELGSHVVLTLGTVAGAPIVERTIALYKGSAHAGTALGSDAVFGGLVERAAVGNRALFVGVNLEAVLALVGHGAGDPFELAEMFDSLGVSGLRSAGYALGFADGDFEGRLALLFNERRDGLLFKLLEGIGPAANLRDSLAKVPASATSIGSERIACGLLVEKTVAWLRERLGDESDESVGFLAGLLESSLGVGLEDLERLGPLDVCVFSVEPPIGGLVDDTFAIVPTEQVAPYLGLVRRVVEEPHEILEREVAGRTVHSVAARVSVMDFLNGNIAPAMYVDGVSWAEIADGITLIGAHPHAVGRYLERYAKEKPASDDAALIALVEGRLAGGMGSVLRGGSALASSYNSFVSLASLVAPMFDRHLAPLGIDVTQLPIGEEFLAGVRDGSLVVSIDEAGLDLHGRAVLTATSDSTLMLVAGASALAGFLFPTLMSSRAEAAKVACMSNLRELAKLSMLYADSADNRSFPYSEEGGIASLQILADFFGNLDPSLFVCRASDQSPAARGPDGKFTLDEFSCSYSFMPGRLAPTDSAILLYERFPHHDGWRWVVDTAVIVELIPEPEFQRALRDAEARAKSRRGTQ